MPISTFPLFVILAVAREEECALFARFLQILSQLKRTFSKNQSARIILIPDAAFTPM